MPRGRVADRPDGLDPLRLVARGGAGRGGPWCPVRSVADTTVLLDVPNPSGQAEDGPERTVEIIVVKVLVHRRDDRGMNLEPYGSRCVFAGEVHELVTTDHRETRPGSRIDRVAFLGFAEITRAGVLDRGDRVRVGDRLVGTVRGFDACHFRNHYNVLIATAETMTGSDLGLLPETAVRFEPATGPGGAGVDRPRRSE